MKTAGIAAEYNPFHHGHRYHIEETRRITGADYIIAVMSGDFVQRGAPAILDKYTRTLMALKGGADLVIELPAASALSSAEGFAVSCMNIFASSNVTDIVSFGAEISGAEDEAALRAAAKILSDEPDHYKDLLSAGLKTGISYPAAVSEALRGHIDHINNSVPRGSSEGKNHAGDPDDITVSSERISSLISLPNNILAAEYLKAISRYSLSLESVMIGRKGKYHGCLSTEGDFISAGAVRRYLKKCSFQNADIYFELSGKVASDDIDILSACGLQRALLFDDDLSDILYYALRNLEKPDRNEKNTRTDLLMRIKNNLEEFTCWSSFAELIHSKNNTLSSVNRGLARILIGAGKEIDACLRECGYAPYIRILGFKKSAAPLIKSLERNSSVPVIKSPAKARQNLGPSALLLMETDIRAADIYNRALFSKSGKKVLNDYRHPLICI